jgi:hypothetical protein
MSLSVDKFPLFFPFTVFLLKRMIHYWKKNRFQSVIGVFVPLILAVLEDVFVVLNFKFDRQFDALDFGCLMLHLLAHSMIYSQGI